MNFPYGTSDFGKIISKGYLYVDRTSHIPLIEKAGEQLVFLRPRRFGKSLLLSMLEHYYDLAKAEQFKQTFARLAISQAPTELHSQYFVLKWDFSAVSPQGDLDGLQRSLYDHINGRIESFAKHYSSQLSCPIKIYEDNALASFQALLTAVNQTSYKLYLLIDEYDNFANEIVMGSRDLGKKRYKELLEGEGILKTVFKAVKAAASGQGLDRVFITGVSPIVLSDLTSGYNVAKSISLEPEFQTLCGFTQDEIAQVLRTFCDQKILSNEKVQECLSLMQGFYNGYCFCYEQTAKAAQPVYNSTMALYFLENLYKRRHYPDNLLDENLAMDRGKLSYIASLPGGERVIQTAIEREPPLTLENLVQRFGIEDVLYAKKDRAFMVGLLYYFGILTLQGRDAFGDLCFGVPNQVIFKLYVQQLKQCFLPDFNDDQLRDAARAFYSRGAFQDIVDMVEQRIFPVLDNRDYAQVNELTIKTAFLLLLFNDRLYQMDSEARVGRGYADLALIVRPDARQYPVLDLVLEFKYVSLKQLGLSARQVKQLKDEACGELEAVKRAFEQAKEQLQRYSSALRERYGQQLQLRSYAVVALGLERLLFREAA